MQQLYIEFQSIRCKKTKPFGIFRAPPWRAGFLSVGPHAILAKCSQPNVMIILCAYGMISSIYDMDTFSMSYVICIHVWYIRSGIGASHIGPRTCRLLETHIFWPELPKSCCGTVQVMMTTWAAYTVGMGINCYVASSLGDFSMSQLCRDETTTTLLSGPELHHLKDCFGAIHTSVPTVVSVVI